MSDTSASQVEGYSGTVGGIVFKDGVAVDGPREGTTADARRLGSSIASYFRRRGYRVEDGRVVRDVEPAPEPPDPRFVGTETNGTPLRDAAVDPRPGDFLPPTNAGQANPHGPEVVSPEIHASQGVRPVLPGPVPEAPAQEPREQAHTTELTATTLERPAKSASKAAWVEYAVAQGADRAYAESQTRDDLATAYTGDA